MRDQPAVVMSCGYQMLRYVSSGVSWPESGTEFPSCKQYEHDIGGRRDIINNISTTYLCGRVMVGRPVIRVEHKDEVGDSGTVGLGGFLVHQQIHTRWAVLPGNRIIRQISRRLDEHGRGN